MRKLPDGDRDPGQSHSCEICRFATPQYVICRAGAAFAAAANSAFLAPARSAGVSAGAWRQPPALRRRGRCGR